MKILITGCAGFIGFHLAKKLCERENRVVGIDNLNAYYDPKLKTARLEHLAKYPNFHFEKIDIVNRIDLDALFKKEKVSHVVNLAAQAGVRYSLEHPYAYIDTNLVGFGNILENCRQNSIRNLVFASSSSVYGANQAYPLHESHCVDHPVALYGATKKANEVMAHSYAHLYGLPCTGLRFFTVYGPWGRPDMALFKFTENILSNKPIDVYNYGNMIRDFTYIDDIVKGIMLTIDNPAHPNVIWNAVKPDPSSSQAPYRIYNIGNGNPVKLMHFIETLESVLGKKAIKNLLPLQPGDVEKTFADISQLKHDYGYQPKVDAREGIGYFIEWYQEYHEIHSLKQPA